MIAVLTMDGKPILIDYRQLIYIERDKRGFIFHTRTEKYRPVTALDQIAEALRPLGFELLHQSNAVNLTNIKVYNRSLEEIYFDKKITKQSKRALISRENKPKLNNYLREHPEINVTYHE
jgi:DNA-binding LytR/AlgR family response regulator